ncbi:MAG: endonuclease III [Bdellovibrionales bacterium]|nr:endonuclease III [Bdellovibrionales bacterium]
MSLTRRPQKKLKPISRDSERRAKVISKLESLYPDAHCALTHKNPLQLLISTILSAQCTDARVNKVTPPLFKKYPSAKLLAKAKIKDLEDMVRSTGFYHNKAKSIKGTCERIVDEFKGHVPETMEELTSLPGVGRKTANVVLGNAFGKNEGIVVDTHVGRLSRRLGFTKHKDPVKIERDLMKIVPKNKWTLWSHWLISHGRRVCSSLRPKCELCELQNLCPMGKK